MSQAYHGYNRVLKLFCDRMNAYLVEKSERIIRVFKDPILKLRKI